MTTPEKNKALLATLRKMNSNYPEIGLVRDILDCGDEKLMMIIQDTPFINIRVQKVIAHLIDYLTKIRVLSLVGCDGASGGVEISTDWLKRIKDQRLRSDVVDALFEEGKLTGLEYCHVFSSTPFVLFAPEDKKLYEQSVALWKKITPLRNFIDEEKTESRIMQAMNTPKWKPLFDDFQEFLILEQRRASAMVDNLDRKMQEMEVQTSALICKGNLPQNIVAELSQRRISYVIVDPAKAAADDKKTYEKMLSQQNPKL